MGADQDAAVARAGELTRALLGFAGRGVNLAAPVSIDAVLGSVLGILERALPSGIVLSRDLAASQSVVGDPTRLEQVAMNLLLNARDAIGDAGQIVVRSRDEGACVVVEVEDDGPGIDPGIREKLFEPFEQGSTASSDASPGTGLGLSLVRQFVGLHDGTIDVGEGAAGGARFEVRLPMGDADA